MPVSVWNRGQRGWFLRYPLRNGRRKAKRVGPPGPDGEAEARRLANEANEHIRADKPLETWRPLQGDPLPIDVAVRGWRDNQGALRSERTRITDHGLVERIAAYFGGTDLRHLSNTRVREFASAIIDAAEKEKRSGSVAGNAISILRRVMNLAVDDGLLNRNPVSEWAKIIREARQKTAHEIKRQDAWTAEEMGSILALAAKHERHVYPVLLAAFHTGARRGELLSLRWEDVDFRRRRIDIRRASAARGGTKIPKARKARLVPLSDALCEMLEALQKAQRRSSVTGRKLQGWVFPSRETGGQWEEHNFSRAWRRLRRKYFAAEKIRPLAFHCTRHTFTTRALESGLPISVVASWVGASTRVLEEHYSHVIPTAWSMEFLGAAPVSGDQLGYLVVPSRRKRRGDPGAIRTRDPQLRSIGPK